MWINPNHPDPPRPPDPPQENGDRLATFERHGGEELRVSLAEFNGHPFVSLRVWAPSQDGQLWPVRGKGVSVKLREVAGLAEALAAVAGQLGDGGPGGRGEGRREPGRGPSAARGPSRGAVQPTRGSAAEGFDEFAGGA